MTENVTLSRRAAVAGATALAAAVPPIGIALAAPARSAGDAGLLRLVGEWFEIGLQLDQAEAQLASLEDAALPDWSKPDGGTDPRGVPILFEHREEIVAYWKKRLDAMAHHHDLPRWQQWRKEALQDFDAWHAELEANRQANGAAGLAPQVEVLRMRQTEVLGQVFALPAQTTAGALAKLRIFAAEDALEGGGPPWATEHLQLVLGDLERLAVNTGRAA
jgi:hypothetical protein